MQDDRDQIEEVISAFFAAFDNRNGRTPRQEQMMGLFAEKAVIAKHQDGHCEVYTPVEFVSPRIALLCGGTLVEFHEWEETALTELVGEIAARKSRYAKSGLFNGAPYAGTGTKFFQLAKFPNGWRVVALSWSDDA
jgi:hypothetical protein